MNKALEAIYNYNKKMGYSTDFPTLLETLREAKEVAEYHHQSHRWWEEYTHVVEIEGRFYGYVWASANRDESVQDLGFVFDYDSVCEMKPVEKMVVVYEKV